MVIIHFRYNYFVHWCVVAGNQGRNQRHNSKTSEVTVHVMNSELITSAS